MDLFEAIYKRHSYRGAFLETAIPRENLIKIVDAGIAAPSGKNAQTTSFIIVDDPALVDTIGRMHNLAAMHSMRALIICVVDENPPAIYEGNDFVVEDCAAAVENMLLAITALGYASVWIDGWLRIQSMFRTIGEMLKVPEGKTIRVILPIGIPAETRIPQQKKPFDKRASFNAYGRSR
jgi:nitroreductase